jgi:enoyl-CoA hydratase/carnithine racemase
MAEVLFREQDAGGGFRLGIATLNAEKSLNALTLEMIRLLDAQLKQWLADEAIACVVLLGAGSKAFCAGGDVRSLRESMLADANSRTPTSSAQTFFGEEYRLDHLIHTYAKPILVWGSGIVMGGGLGLLAGASHRVVTETSRIAMPEVTIGLYPDVGGSWFLQRMPGRTGLFLALTGAPLNGHDALVVGLADHFVGSTDFHAVLESLSRVMWTSKSPANHAALSAELRKFAAHAKDVLPASNVSAHAAAIEDLTGAATLQEVVRRIASYQGEEGWLKKAAATMAAGCPTSIALAWELRQRAKHLSLAQVFQLELIVSVQCAMHPNFPEGVRALLVDKDNKPRWTPASLEALTSAWIAEHFVAPWGNAPHPLADLSD